MDRVRQAMELALREHWEEPLPRAPRESIERLHELSPRHKAQAADIPPRVPSAGRNPVEPPSRVSFTSATLVKARLVAAITESPHRAAYCLLSTVVSERMAEGGFTSIGVTSPRGARGKTLTAANLAISLAIDAHRAVLLMDLDLRRPAIHRLFELGPVKGLESALFGGLALQDVLLATSIDGLMVLPSEGNCPNVPQILCSSNLRALMNKAVGRLGAPITVIDLPVLSSPEDAAIFETLVDTTLLVVEDDVTREAHYMRALQSLKKDKLMGTVLNKVRKSEKR